MFGRAFATRFAPATFVVATLVATAVAVLRIVLALNAIIRDLRLGRDDNTRARRAHRREQRRGIVWLIAVPVLLLAFVVPPALGAPTAAPIGITLSPNELRQFRRCRPGAHRKSRRRKY